MTQSVWDCIPTLERGNDEKKYNKAGRGMLPRPKRLELINISKTEETLGAGLQTPPRLSMRDAARGNEG